MAVEGIAEWLGTNCDVKMGGMFYRTSAKNLLSIRQIRSPSCPDPLSVVPGKVRTQIPLSEDPGLNDRFLPSRFTFTILCVNSISCCDIELIAVQ